LNNTRRQKSEKLADPRTEVERKALAYRLARDGEL